VKSRQIGREHVGERSSVAFLTLEEKPKGDPDTKMVVEHWEIEAL